MLNENKLYVIKNNNWEVPEFTCQNLNKTKTKYCICVPILNEEKRIHNQLKKMQKYSCDINIIICDGGSTDNSIDIDYFKEVGVSVLLIKKGPGFLSAQMRMGMAYALQESYAGIIFIDGNDKDDPKDIPNFIKELENGFDHIQGSRFKKGGRSINTPFLRYWAVRLIHSPLISLAARYYYTDTTNGFRAYSSRFLLDNRVKPFRDVFSEYELHYYLSIRASRLGYKIKEIPVKREYPKEGQTPSKIKGLKGNIKILKTLVNVCMGKFNPRKEIL